GLVQITYSRPRLRTSLQFSQIRLTLARTFIANLASHPLGKICGNYYCTRTENPSKGKKSANPTGLASFFRSYLEGKGPAAHYDPRGRSPWACPVGALIRRHDDDSFFGDGDGVLDVGAGEPVAGDHRPVVGQGADFGPAHVDHGLDR